MTGISLAFEPTYPFLRAISIEGNTMSTDPSARSSYMFKRIPCIAAALFFGFVLDLRAQDETPTTVTVQNRSGDLPFSSSIGTDVEHVDVASGNLIVHIPFTSVKGRGMDFNFVLNYD